MGLNELQTLFRAAITDQKFDEASRLRDILADRVSSGAYRPKGEDKDEDKRRLARLSWQGLGTAPWLKDRLASLGYQSPTTIQINAFEAVNTILANLAVSVGGGGGEAGLDGELDGTLEERIWKFGGGFGVDTDASMGVVISGSTGSGKTLAYLVPMLSTLSESLFSRERIRIKAEEDVGDAMDDVLSRVVVATSPTLQSQNRKQVGGTGVTTVGASLSTLGKSGTDVRSPLALIVVPTRELGVQTALLLYQLVGGNLKQSATEMLGMANMFKYKGPKGVKIGCVLDSNESSLGLKLQTDVAITTPAYLGKLLRDGDVDPSKLRVVIYDEADLALEQTSEDDLKVLFKEDEEREFSRLTYLVGASVTESLGQLAVKESVLPFGRSFIATASDFAPLSASDTDEKEATEAHGVSMGDNGHRTRTASLKDLGLCLDQGLRHERVVAPDNTGLLCLARMLRSELRQYETTLESGTNTTKLQRPRVVVFFPGEEEARAAIEPLRDAMWGEHQLCVLLPNTGETPLRIMEDFKAGKTSVMLATPNSVRGLDFPSLTHCYTLYLPADDPREYLHLAGRVGRLGQLGSVLGSGGRVISILTPEEADKMVDLARELNFTFVDVEPETETLVRTEDGGFDVDKNNVEVMRRYLEDSLTLLKDIEDVNPASVPKDGSIIDAEIIDDEDDDDDDEGEDANKDDR